MPQSGLSSLKRAMQAYFTAQSVSTTVFIGLRRREDWNLSRVVLIPGFFDGNPSPKTRKGGRIDAPLHASSINPAELQRWDREITISVFAVDKTNLTDPEVQNTALENMVEATIQAVWCGVDPTAPAGSKPAGMAGFVWGDVDIVEPPVQNNFGQEVLLHGTHTEPFYELVRPFVIPTPQLATKQVFDSSTSGRAASVSFAGSGSASIAGFAGLARLEWVGGTITIAGAASSGNNGTFPITGFTSPSVLVVTNASAVAPDANNGRISWSVTPPTPQPGA